MSEAFDTTMWTCADHLVPISCFFHCYPTLTVISITIFSLGVRVYEIISFVFFHFINAHFLAPLKDTQARSHPQLEPWYRGQLCKRHETAVDTVMRLWLEPRTVNTLLDQYICRLWWQILYCHYSMANIQVPVPWRLELTTSLDSSSQVISTKRCALAVPHATGIFCITISYYVFLFPVKKWIVLLEYIATRHLWYQVDLKSSQKADRLWETLMTTRLDYIHVWVDNHQRRYADIVFILFLTHKPKSDMFHTALLEVIRANRHQ